MSLSVLLLALPAAIAPTAAQEELRSPLVVDGAAAQEELRSPLVVDEAAAQEELRSPLIVDEAAAQEAARAPWHVDEAAARKLWPELAAIAVWDPIGRFVPPGGVDRWIGFPEHPDGGWRQRTNALGLREDREFELPGDRRRILVVGGGETEGRCAAREAWPRRLEHLFQASHPTPQIEVVNAAHEHFGPFQAQAEIDRLEALDPELVILTLTWNDFRTSIEPWKHFTHQGTGPVGVERDLAAYHYLADHPDELDLAQRALLLVVLELLGRLEARATRLLVVYLPAPFEVENVARLRARYPELTGQELSAEQRNASRARLARFFDGMRAQMVPVLDPREPLSRAHQDLYWRSEPSLSAEGHLRLAELLVPTVSALLERRYEPPR